jgi:hypothetical protein
MIRPPFRFLFGSVLLFSGVSPSPIAANDEALALITRGGGEITAEGFAPGLIELANDSAFPVLKDATGGILAAGGAAATAGGESRVVVFAHDSFLRNAGLLGDSAVRELVLNSIRWCGQSEKPEVALHPELGALAAILEEAGFRVKQVAPEEVSRGSVKSVYVTVAQKGFDEESVAAVLERAQQGAGLVLAATPWPFGNDYPNFATFPANRLAEAAGVRLKSGGTANSSKPFAVKHTDSKAVLATLRQLIDGPLPGSPSERAAAGEAIGAGSALRGPALDEFLAGLLALNRKLGPIVPTQEAPVVRGADPLVDAVIDLETTLDQSLPAGKMYAIPAAADYPGAVPDKAPRINRNLTIDGDWRGWLSGRGAAAWAAKEMRPTGLYAAPGEVITVNAPAEIAGKGFEVVIGSYGGGLDNREKWERYPRLQRSVEINGPVTTISSGLGGLVTIRVPKDAKAGPLAFSLSGGVAAPVYVAGKTDLKQWRSDFRKSPAPWAELVSDRIILALPSRYLRDLDDPDEVMKAWDEIIDKAAELCGGVDRNQYRAERIVFDRQTAAGYMHSSYPVAAPQDRSVEQAVDAKALREEGNWGFFHEYGHNHQHDLWALPGTGETTCNLWSVYLFEEWVGKPREEGHDAVRPLDRKQRMNAYFEGGRNFESDWSVWTALETYLQVQEAFGWEPFKKVFAEYNALPESEWPKTQQEKNDQWVIRLSRACGKNLAPFWNTWNVPLSDSVHSELSGLPAWENHPVSKWAE